MVAFLEGRKLGPAGRSLYDILAGYRPLTEAQEELLQKVLANMGCHDVLQDIKDELAITIQALAACDTECSSSALDMT